MSKSHMTDPNNSAATARPFVFLKRKYYQFHSLLSFLLPLFAGATPMALPCPIHGCRLHYCLVSTVCDPICFSFIQVPPLFFAAVFCCCPDGCLMPMFTVTCLSAICFSCLLMKPQWFVH